MKPFQVSLSILAGLLASAPAFAQSEYSMGAGLRYVRMTEMDASGRQLVREHGWLPGVGLSATRRYQTWTFGLSGEIYGADLDYDGRLQNGVPFTTDTATTQGRIAAEVTRQLTENTTLVGGLEYDGWRRHVLGRDGIAGVRENYSSWRLLAGAASSAWHTSSTDFRLKGLLVLAGPERLHAHFENQLYDDAVLNTRSAQGLRLDLTGYPRAFPRFSFGINVDWMRIRRSNDEVLRKDGLPTGTVTQPEHERSAIGFHAGYHF